MILKKIFLAACHEAKQKFLRGSRGPHGMGDLLELALLSSEFYPGPYALGSRLKLFKKSPPGRRRLFNYIAGIFLFFAIALPLISRAADCEQAKVHYNKALKLNESIANLVKKEQLYKRAVALCPSYAAAHNNLGDVYEKLGRIEAAITQYKKAAELQPEAPWPYFGLGDIYCNTGRYQEAVKWYNKGLKYKPDDRLTLWGLASINDIQKQGVIKAITIMGMLTKMRGIGEEVSISFGEGLIPFDFDKYEIRLDARPQLNEIGSALREIYKKNIDISIDKRDVPQMEIAGHTDAIGTDEYNIRLSQKRSQSVINYLVKNFNIPPEWLRPVGYGERVPICSVDASDACHALNRRVEIVLRPVGEVTRSGSYRSVNQPEIIMDIGFFFKRMGKRTVEVLKEGSRLRSELDRYFVFFRPLRDCYVYILQEDSSGGVDLVFPGKGKNARVKKDREYWVPGFGRAYTLDETKGEETLCLLATSWPLEAEIKELSLKEQVRDAVRALKTRAIRVVRPSDVPENISSEELDKKPQKIKKLIERIKGRGGWVRIVRFRHE